MPPSSSSIHIKGLVPPCSESILIKGFMPDGQNLSTLKELARHANPRNSPHHPQHYPHHYPEHLQMLWIGYRVQNSLNTS